MRCQRSEDLIVSDGDTVHINSDLSERYLNSGYLKKQKKKKIQLNDSRNQNLESAPSGVKDKIILQVKKKKKLLHLFLSSFLLPT